MEAASRLIISKGVANAIYFTHCIKVILVIRATIPTSLTAVLVSFAALHAEVWRTESVYPNELKNATRNSTLVALENG